MDQQPEPTSPDPERYPIHGTLAIYLHLDAWYADEEVKALVVEAVKEYSPVLMHLLRTHVAQVLGGEVTASAHLN
jgi:hypothetical protein